MEDCRRFGGTNCLHLQGQTADSQREVSRKQNLFGLLFDPEDGGSMFLIIVGELVPDYTALHPRSYSSKSLMRDFKSNLSRIYFTET
jgi:hypothetical protein